MRRNQAVRKTNKLEQLGYRLLDEIGLNYEQQYVVGRYVVDAFVPSAKMVVQFDGDYWHGNQKIFPVLTERQYRQQNTDRLQCETALKLGYVTFRIWESDIKKQYQQTKESLQIFLKEMKIAPPHRGRS